VLLVLSSLWTVATLSPLFYSLLFPNQDIQHIVRALEGRETLREELTPLVRGTIDTSGHLKRAIQVGAYFYASAEQKLRESHTTKEVEIAYLAWFEKRSKPTILVITRTEIDGSLLRFHTYEGRPIGTIRAYLLPVLVLAFSVYWFRRRDSFFREEPKS
jgi:hypothetical protein